MADAACGVSYSSSRMSNNRGISVTRNCEKCEEVEKQLRKLLDELSSAHLIIQMLEKESRTEDAPTTLNQQDENYAAVDWEVKLTKGKKGSPEGKRKINITEGTRPKMDTVELRNCFSAFATDREMRLSDNKENKCDNLSRSNTSAPKIHTKQYRRAYIRGLLEKYPTFFLCEHLMDYNLARLHEPTLNLSAHA